MESIKELSRWLKKQVKFLTENNDYLGSWKRLDDYFCVVILWEEGWGNKKRDDVIQAEADNDWGLCAGIKIYNPKDTIDMWVYPWDKESSDLICESFGIHPRENFDLAAKTLLESYAEVKGTKPEADGSISFDVPPDEIAAIIEPEEAEVEEEPEQPEQPEELKEDINRPIITDWVEEVRGEITSRFLDNQEEWEDGWSRDGDDSRLVLFSMPEEELEKMYHFITEKLIDEWNVIDMDAVRDGIEEILYAYLDDMSDPRNFTAEISPDDVNESLIKNEFTKDELNGLEVELYDFMSENNKYLDNCSITNSTSTKGDLTLNITVSGDWKHDHLYTKHLVQKWCDENGMNILDHTEEAEDGDGSDSYTAEHYWELRPVKTIDILKDRDGISAEEDEDYDAGVVSSLDNKA